jgi:hypothetical protein
MPAEFMMMISESVDSLLSTCATAISSAIGAMTRIKSGMIIPVMPTKTRMFWPWLVMILMSCSAWVTQITAVKLTSTIRKEANVVRKIYRLIDPIRDAVPQFRNPSARPPRDRFPQPDTRDGAVASPQPAPRITLIRLQSGRAKAKPLNMRNKRLNPGGPPHVLIGVAHARFSQTNTAFAALFPTP